MSRTCILSLSRYDVSFIRTTASRASTRYDMIAVGLVDATWPARYPAALAARLQHLLDTPDG